jgi:host factor-I protein
MSMGQPQALQDTFLEHVRKHKVSVTIFLANGIRLQGYVQAFDSYSLLLGRDYQSQLVYKHAVSTIMPVEPVQMGQSDEHESCKG